MVEQQIHANATGDHIAYFGYGSLVNQATHRTDIVGFKRAQLSGWRRGFFDRGPGKFGPVAILSVFPNENCQIDGLLVIDRMENLGAIDLREARYNRQQLDHNTLKLMTPDNQDGIWPDLAVHLYVAKPAKSTQNTVKCLILRSYLDAVMQGYLDVFGRGGLERFVATTDNFDLGIHEDRRNPIYPRAVVTTTRQRALFDQLV